MMLAALVLPLVGGMHMQMAHRSLHTQRHHVAPLMGAPELFASCHVESDCTLPLIVANLDDALLPGESRAMFIERADELAAVDAAQDAHNCIGMLLRTAQHNALVAAPLLEIRHVRRLEVGAFIDVVAVGRVEISKVENARYLRCPSPEHLIDSELVGVAVHSTDPALMETVTTATEQLRDLLQKLAEAEGEEHKQTRGVVVPTKPSPVPRTYTYSFSHSSNNLLPLQEAATRRSEELCATGLDRPALESLERLHSLWGVADEQAAREQVYSFAACGPLSAVRRAQALGITNTARRLEHAHSGLLRATKVVAAKLALCRALRSSE